MIARSLPDAVVDEVSKFRAVLGQGRSDGWSVVAEVVAALASSASVGRSSVEEVRGEVVPLPLDAAERISADLGHKGRRRREGFY